MAVELIANLICFGMYFTGTNVTNYPKGTEHTASVIRYMKERERKNLFFRAETMTSGLEYLKNMFCLGTSGFTCDMVVRTWQQYRFFYLAALLCSTPVLSAARKRLTRRSTLAVVMEWAELPVYAFLLLWSVSCIMIGSHNPFIYFNF